ncbi:hypothetical protein B0A52_05883 [Exophiala mesophila]|uniref:Transcription factor domain-containing protein n=1 Tax=Exophiala mesophila TaxID=212818 RepID=A0A438N3S3_EXOME|nr:hypothetical protein B0A52_05883 [Exophiala mesophila]
MRRQKCDRNVPCGRCVKRGDADRCTRDWPGGYDPKLHRIYPRSLGSGGNQRGDSPHGSGTSTGGGGGGGAQSPTATVTTDSIHPSLRTPGSNATSGPSPRNPPPPSTIGHGSPVRQPSSSHYRPSISIPNPISNPISQPTSANINPNANTTSNSAPTTSTNSHSHSNPNPNAIDTSTELDFITWGRTKLSDYDLKALELLKEPHQAGGVPNRMSAKDTSVDWELQNCLGGTGAAQVSFLQLLLPSRRQVYQLVEYHVSTILWYHACFHAPTFYEELSEAYKNGQGELQIRDTDLRWTALLFAIMSASMVCANDQIAQTWGFRKSERAKLTRQWYKATVTCLNLSDYMWRHHIYSVEAITVLTMSAHILGFSNTQSTLLGAAFKIAQGLGLQRLGPEDDVNSVTGNAISATPAQRDKAIKRETGRRLWSQICLQDWFSIPFSEMYSIQRSHYTSLKPLHCDEHTMQPLPDNVPAMTSFPVFLNAIAELMPQIHDAIISSNTLYTKYEQVLEYDSRMRRLATEGLPKYFSTKEPIDPDWPPFIPWARRGLTICFAHKIIMIHRAFLGRSFTESSFDFTRRTCMVAAKTILKEARQAYDEDGPMLWIDQAFMVAAGITLALDIFHRTNSEPEYEEHRKLVENTISLLSKFEHSMIALRGIRLLSSLLAEQARLSADQTLENYRKRTYDTLGDRGSQMKRQKFNVPKFVESFVGNDNFTNSLRNTNRDTQPSMDLYEPNTMETRAPMDVGSQETFITSDLGYETFEQLFPPHTGISNNFLFEDLLNFDI